VEVAANVEEAVDLELTNLGIDETILGENGIDRVGAQLERTGNEERARSNQTSEKCDAE